MSQDPAASKGASRTVGGAMVTRPKALPLRITVAQARDAFDNDHVHMLVLTGQGVPRGTLVRGDLDETHGWSKTYPALRSLSRPTLGVACAHAPSPVVPSTPQPGGPRNDGDQLAGWSVPSVAVC